jgi:hypothetical protein
MGTLAEALLEDEACAFPSSRFNYCAHVQGLVGARVDDPEEEATIHDHAEWLWRQTIPTSNRVLSRSKRRPFCR